MSITLSKLQLHHLALKTQGFIFWPSPQKIILPSFALMTHGYSASKNDLFSWASKLCEEGITVCLFDLPGHYLGGFNDVEKFADFTFAHELFAQGLENIRKNFFLRYPLYEHFNDSKKINLILAGHSLGALLALKALSLPAFVDYKRLAIAVGFGHGLSPDTTSHDQVHLFQTPLFKNTLNLRAQLVSPALCPENIFPWIKDEKASLELPGERIHLITGLDDVIVAPDGAERLKAQLEKKGSTVTLERPLKLPHHEAAAAATHIKSFLRKNNFIEKKQ